MSDDLISREALKKAFEDCTGECACCVHNTNDFEYCGLIDNAPTIEPEKICVNVRFDKEQLQEIVDKAKTEILASAERPHGKWIFNKYTGDIICSCCRQSRRDTRKNHILFCNHCGAKMDGGEE